VAVTIKNLSVDPPQVTNDGRASFTLSCRVFTSHDHARITHVEVDLSAWNGPANQPLQLDPKHTLADSAEGDYNVHLDVPLLADPGQYDLPVSARDSDGGVGKKKVHLQVDYQRPSYTDGLSEPENREAIARLVERPVVEGNWIEVLVDGWEAFERRLQLIEAANTQINLELYYLSDEGQSRRLYQALLDKAGSGVEVNVILNSDTQLANTPMGTLRLRFHNLLLDLQSIGQKLEERRQQKEAERDWLQMLSDFGQGKRGINMILFSGQMLRDQGDLHQHPGHSQAVWLQKIRRDKRQEEESDWLSSFRGPGGLPALPLLDYAVHEKILVVDGEKAIVGGRNIEDPYFQHWIDEDLYLEGPIVEQIQRGFLRNFVEFAQGIDNVKPATELIGDVAPRGDTPALFVQSRPWRRDYDTMQALITAIQMAQHRIYASSQYVILPDVLLRDALFDAAARGLDIRILTNSHQTCQEVGFSTGYYISLNYFAELLNAGIKLYEISGSNQPDAPQPYYHAKEFLIDGEMTAIGSFNLSIRSCYIESENLVFCFDKKLTAQQEALFQERLEHKAEQITQERLRHLIQQHKSKTDLARYVELLY